MTNLAPHKEEAQVQTVILGDDIGNTKNRLKNLEDSNEANLAKLESNEKMIKSLKDGNYKLLWDLKEKEDEIFILVSKVDKYIRIIKVYLKRI